MDKPHFHINREQQQRFLWYWPPIFDAGHTSTNMMQSTHPLSRYSSKNLFFVWWPRVTSKKLHIPEFFGNKQSANKLVKIKKKSSSSPQRSSLKSPERKRTCWTNHSRSEDTTLSTKQLKRTALMDMPPHPPIHKKEASEESKPACSTSPLTDSTFQGSHAAVHAHWSSLTCLTFPGPHGWLIVLCPAEKATQHYAGGASPASPCTHYHLEHGQGECFGLQRDSHSIWEALNCKTRLWPRNLAVIYDW